MSTYNFIPSHAGLKKKKKINYQNLPASVFYANSFENQSKTPEDVMRACNATVMDLGVDRGDWGRTR